jgi:hypothetical protein
MSELELWKNSLPLRLARERFASPDFRAELGKFPEATGVETLRLMAVTFQETDPGKKAAANDSLAGINAASSSRKTILDAMAKQVFRRYRVGELLLLGFEHPRQAASAPIRFRADLLTYMPHWESGSYRHEGLYLIELRLIESPKHDVTSDLALHRASGRPGFRVEIVQAFDALMADGSFVSRPLSKGIVQIRDWIRKNLPDTKAAKGVLSDDAIRNAIKPRLEKTRPGKVEKL